MRPLWLAFSTHGANYLTRTAVGLNTPEWVKSVDYYAGLLRRFARPAS